MFISLEGVDGCGKSTLVKAVVQKMKVNYFSRKQFPTGDSFAELQLQKVAKLMWTEHNEKDSELSNEYWIHLHALWYTILQDTLKLKEKFKTGLYIADGWYYKIWANLIEQGNSIENIKNVFYNIIKPDIVILLKVSEEQLYRIYEKNKHRFSSFELGAHQQKYADNLGKSSFIVYQTSTQNKLIQLSDFNWHIVDVDSYDLEKNTQKIIQAINSEVKNYEERS